MAVLENFNTFGDVITEAFNELAENSDSSVPGFEQSQMEKWGNRYSKWFLEKVKLKSQEEGKGFLVVADTTLSSSASSGASSVSIKSATGFPTGGGLIIIDNIPHQYSSISGTTVTLTDTLARDMASGDTVQPTYAFPPDFGKLRSLYIESVRYALVRWGEAETLPSRCVTTYKGFFVLPQAGTAGDDAVLNYFAKATNTLADTTTMEIYQAWDAYVIYRLVARGHRLLYDDNRAAEYESLAQEVLMKAKQFVATEDDSQQGNMFIPSW